MELVFWLVLVASHLTVYYWGKLTGENYTAGKVRDKIYVQSETNRWVFRCTECNHYTDLSEDPGMVHALDCPIRRVGL